MVLRQDQKAAVVLDQVQTIVLIAIALTDPRITRRAVPGSGGKADQCQPFAMNACNVPQRMTDLR